jgi:DNA-binding response OmpR family regulator
MKGSSNPVLLVEDDPNDVLLIERAFLKAGTNVVINAVQDGEMATKYLAAVGDFADRVKFPFPNLVLLDLKLPRKNGFELLAWLRGQESPLRRLPVIVFTSSQQSVDVSRAYELGANSYIVKPGSFDELLKVVKTLDRYWFGQTQKPEMVL